MTATRSTQVREMFERGAVDSVKIQEEIMAVLPVQMLPGELTEAFIAAGAPRDLTEEYVASIGRYRRHAMRALRVAHENMAAAGRCIEALERRARQLNGISLR